jgi:hypothetical protein
VRTIILIFVMMSAPMACSEPNTVALIPSQCVTNHYPLPITRVLLSADLDPDHSTSQLRHRCSTATTFALDCKDQATILSFPNLLLYSTLPTAKWTAHFAGLCTRWVFGQPSLLPSLINTNIANNDGRCPQFMLIVHQQQLASKSSAFRLDTDYCSLRIISRQHIFVAFWCFISTTIASSREMNQLQHIPLSSTLHQ